MSHPLYFLGQSNRTVYLNVKGIVRAVAKSEEEQEAREFALLN